MPPRQPSQPKPETSFNGPFPEKPRLAHRVFIPAAAFSFLGLVWAIPVPYFSFLGRLNGYINLATFLIVLATVFYLRLRFRLGLAMILTIWVFSAGIIFLERMARLHQWPEMWQVCLALFLSSTGGLVLTLHKTHQKAGLKQLWQYLLLGLPWLWAHIFRKLGFRS